MTPIALLGAQFDPASIVVAVASGPAPTTAAPAARSSGANSGASQQDGQARRRSEDSVELSNAARQAAAGDAADTSATAAATAATASAAENHDDADVGDEATADAKPGAPRGQDGEPLSEEQVKQVDELEARDREVRTHEQAHKAAAGSYATSGPTYSYEQGPDGKRYAVGGSVGIDTSSESTPEQTISKMQTIRRAALAPGEPSGQDRQVAAQASQTERKARQERTEQRQAEAASPRSSSSGNEAVNGTPAATDEEPQSLPPFSTSGLDTFA